MKKKLPFLLSLFILVSACGVKQTQNLLGSGNYDQAIDNAISNLRTNKDKKRKNKIMFIY